MVVPGIPRVMMMAAGVAPGRHSDALVLCYIHRGDHAAVVSLGLRINCLVDLRHDHVFEFAYRGVEILAAGFRANIDLRVAVVVVAP
jgi:hypothetical protein